MNEGRHRRARLRALVIAASAILLGSCSDEGDDLSPVEPEIGEEDTEIVPGESGPVD